MAKEPILTKDKFFQNIFECALGNFVEMEVNMGIKGLINQVFGIAEYDYEGTNIPSFISKSDKRSALSFFRKHDIWIPFEFVYEYAVNGICKSSILDHLTEAVDFSNIIHSDHFQILPETHEIILMGLVRYALEKNDTVNYYCSQDGIFNYPKAIAKLADIDIRTLRNAISANEILMTSKFTLDASSLKQWLLSRKGFRPTTYLSENTLNINFSSPIEFSKLLKMAREKLTDKFDPQELLEYGASYHPDIIHQLEAGIFDYPIGIVTYIAKTYQLPYPNLLNQILKIYYPNDYAILSN